MRKKKERKRINFANSSNRDWRSVSRYARAASTERVVSKTTNTGDRIIDSLFLLAGAPCYVMYRGCSRSLVRLSLILAFDLLLMEPMRYVASCTKRSPQRFPPEGSWHNSSSFIPTVYYIVRSIASDRCKANESYRWIIICSDTIIVRFRAPTMEINLENFLSLSFIFVLLPPCNNILRCREKSWRGSWFFTTFVHLYLYKKMYKVESFRKSEEQARSRKFYCMQNGRDMQKYI